MKNASIQLWAEDEVHFQRHSTITRMWSLKGKFFLILDNASWHRVQDLKKFFFENRHRLVRVFLPPYSPELNPIERVWRITRRQITHNRYFESIEDLEAALIPHFSKSEQPNNALKVLCANI